MTIEVIFFDVGGVLGTNGWDRHSRRAACDRFDLDWEDFQDRHDFVSSAFETGEMDLTTYLERTIFYREREFTPADFAGFMRGQSVPDEAALEVVRRVGDGGRYLLATLNNESRELNEHRIGKFGLADHFTMFLSSCYLGVRKPEPEIYRIAVDLVQRPAEACVFVDDRALNLECAVMAGIKPVHFGGADRLPGQLAELGVEV